MKSRWHRGQGDDQHAPVEMRFIDMFMTAIGSLVFITMLLVFLLPKTTESTAKDKVIVDLKTTIEQLKTEDKKIVLRRFGVMLVTDGECNEQPELYVRWEGKTEDFLDPEKKMGEVVQFDASDPAKKVVLVGQSYFNVGGILQPPRNKRLYTEIFLTTVRSPGSYSVYTGLKDPGAREGKGCTIYPFYLSPEGVTSGNQLVLTRRRPYAWLRRFTVNVDGTTTLKTAPKEDDDFKRELAEFSKEQSQKLCDRKKICDTIDAHYALFVPPPPDGTQLTDKTEFIGTAVVNTTQVNVRSAPDPNDNHNIIGKLNRGRVVNVVRQMKGWNEIETTCDDTDEPCHGFVKDTNLTNFNVRTPGPTR